MVSIIRLLGVLLGAFLISASPASVLAASQASGKIAGTVVDQASGEPLPGATVVIQGTTLGAAADVDGDYVIINVPPGVHTVRASMIGFATVLQQDVRVSIDRTTRVDFSLGEEIIQGEEVIVTAVRPLVEVDRTTSISYIGAESIANLPVQEVKDLLELQSGVAYDAQGRLHLRGGRSGEVAYLVDGIPVTNQYSGGSKIEIENSWIQELQVISGVFNAEYGQAQSGVINIVTKSGSVSNYSGSVGVYTGSYLTSHPEVFNGAERFRMDEYNLEASIEGPLSFLPGGSFFGNLRFVSDDGWLYGERRALIGDTVPIQQYIQEAQQSSSDLDNLVGIGIPDSLMSGDRSLVAMNPRQRLSGHGRVAFQPMKDLRGTYALFLNDQERKSYQDSRRFSPDGQPLTTERGANHLMSLTYSASARTYVQLGLSYQTNTQSRSLFSDPLDTRYQGSAYSANGFSFGGTSNSRGEATNSTALAKLQVESQVNGSNLVKAGGQLQFHRVEEFSQLTISDGPVYISPTQRVPAGNTAGNDQYVQKPREAVFFIQDKVEIDELVLNAGLRFDYWDPNGSIPANLEASTDASNGIRLATGFVRAERATQISPRLGLAFPISERGVLHVSYGRFFQVPRFSFIYANSEFEVELGNLQTIMGNANLKPERTTAYELGLQYSLARDLKIELTVYYKDIKNLLGQEIISTVDKKVYARYVNRDYGNTKGFAASLIRQYSNNFGVTLDYTYQVARGNASDPNSVFFNNQTQPPVEPEKQVLPLNWDQRHSLNGTLIMGNSSGTTLSLIARFASGQPYTPSNPGSQLSAQLSNSESKPSLLNIDVNIARRFKMAGYSARVYAKAFNVLDRLNSRSIYTSTGNPFHPYRTLGETEVLNQNRNFTVDEIDLRPDFLDPPRRVTIGLDITF